MTIDFSEIERGITNGFPIEELEAKLRPQKPEWKEGEWSDHSSGGFLAPDEKLIEVVRADYDALLSLGKSYEDMARLASNILKQISRESFPGGNRLTRGIRRYLAKNWKPIVKIDRERFTLMPIGSMGSQSCPWECKGTDQFGYPTSGGGHIYVMEGEGWSDLLEKYSEGMVRHKGEAMKDFERSLGIEFGEMDRAMYLSAFTVISDLTPHLIASHNFFQGEASYRTDPAKLLQVAGME